MKRFFLTLSLLTLLPAFAHADSTCSQEKSEERLFCYQYYTAHMAEKISEAEREWAQSDIKKPLRSSFAQAQKAWHAFVRQDCDLAAAVATGGNGKPEDAALREDAELRQSLAGHQCLYRHHNTRVKEIQELYRNLEASYGTDN